MGYERFSPKQRRVLSWWMLGSPDTTFEAIVCDGAVRSGKTLAMGLSFFLWGMVCFDGKRFGVCGKTIASLRRNVLSEILPRLEGLGATWKERRTENVVTVTFRGHRNQFYMSKSWDSMNPIVTPLGQLPGGQYLYIGPAEQPIAQGDQVYVDDQGYVMRRVETYLDRNGPVYRWALCVRKGGVDKWGVIPSDVLT